MIVGLDHPDDAGVVRLADDLALIQTVDFFTPIVDDPYAYGQIAAANALSDVYAMGGTPIAALNLLCLPVGKIDPEAVAGILAGGRDKATEAGCPVIGGQSVEDRELKYGMAVTGRVHPERVLTKRGARPGDVLVRLTHAFQVHACTDITGFGLLGHASEMVRDTEVGFRIDAATVPRFDEALARPYRKLRTRADGTNRDYTRDVATVDPAVGEMQEALFYDPQTSGGLLVTLPERRATGYLQAIVDEGYPLACAVIGTVEAALAGRIVVGFQRRGAETQRGVRPGEWRRSWRTGRGRGLEGNRSTQRCEEARAQREEAGGGCRPREAAGECWP